MSADLADAVPTIGCETVAVSLAPVTHGDYSLGITVPGDVVDAPADDGVFAFGVNRFDSVPDSDFARDVA